MSRAINTITAATAVDGATNLNIDSGTLFVNTTTNNVGIGTTSPSVASGLGLVMNGGASQTRLAFKNTYTGDASNDGVQFALVAASSSFIFQNRESDGSFAFETNNTERLRIDSSGRVGIGTTSPQEELQINATEPTIRLEENGAGSKRLELSINSSAEAKIFSNQSGGILAFGTVGTERMRIDSSGNVGIGTNNPSSLLHVASSNAIIRLQDTDTVGNGSNGIATWITFRDSANAQTGYFGFPADPNFHVWNITNSPMLFGTNNQERLRITNDGTILFAKSTTSISTVGYRFDANGESFFSNAASTSAGATLYVYSTGVAAYRFYVGLGGTVNATNTAIAAISDVRLKENIRDIDAGLNEILELKPRTFDWKEGKGANTKNARGFIAQEIEQVFPDLVDEWRDPAPEGEEPYKSVRQDLIPVLVKAIQELKSENDSLKSRVEALEVV